MYTPQPDEEGLGLIKAALRDYIAADLSAYGLPSVTALLPNGAASILDEGFLTAETAGPAVVFTTIGDGQSAQCRANSLVRLIVYAIDTGRGLSKIERVVHRLRKRLNSTTLALDFLTFPPEVELRVENIEASASTASASLPAWKAEARGVYVFLTIRGMQAESWSA